MRRLVAIALLASCGTTAWAQLPAPIPLLSESFQWFGPPNNPNLRAAWVIGSEANDGAYLMGVMLVKGGKIPAHTHPDERNSTVLAGITCGQGTVM